MAAPAPTDRFGTVVPFQGGAPGATYAIEGVVEDLAGAPVAGAAVWIELVDLRDPVNNLGPYEAGKAASRVLTDATGTFGVSAADGYYFLTASRAGRLPVRARVPLPPVAGQPVRVRLIEAPRAAVVAHRGASFYAPENTLAAVRKAAALGATYAEIDVQLTADDEVVAMRDGRLTRTTDGAGLVRDLPLDALAERDAGTWFHPSFAGEPIPTLAAALTAADTLGLQLFVDLKSSPADAELLAARVGAVIRAASAQAGAVMISFDPPTIAACAAASDLRCGLLRGGTGAGVDAVRDALQAGATSVLMVNTLVDTSSVALAHEAGLLVFAWTVNAPDEWTRLVALGVDGIVTDRPGYLTDHLAAVVSSQALPPMP